jgi:hypothetical protein
MQANDYKEQKRLLAVQHQEEKFKLIVNHNIELTIMETNKESTLSKNKTLLRHAFEIVSLSQSYLNLEIKLYHEYKSSNVCQ